MKKEGESPKVPKAKISSEAHRYETALSCLQSPYVVHSSSPWTSSDCAKIVKIGDCFILGDGYRVVLCCIVDLKRGEE